MSKLRTHNRKCGLCGAALTLGRWNRYTMEVMREVRQELEEAIEAIGFLDDAPFEWITLMLLFGLKNESIPHFRRISRRWGDLPLSIELDTHDLMDASREELKRLFMVACLKALVHAGKRYGLPTATFERRLQELTGQSHLEG